jgi:hypothetical protein
MVRLLKTIFWHRHVSVWGWLMEFSCPGFQAPEISFYMHESVSGVKAITLPATKPFESIPCRLL